MYCNDLQDSGVEHLSVGVTKLETLRSDTVLLKSYKVLLKSYTVLLKTYEVLLKSFQILLTKLETLRSDGWLWSYGGLMKFY